MNGNLLCDECKVALGIKGNIFMGTKSTTCYKKDNNYFCQDCIKNIKKEENNVEKTEE